MSIARWERSAARCHLPRHRAAISPPPRRYAALVTHDLLEICGMRGDRETVRRSILNKVQEDHLYTSSAATPCPRRTRVYLEGRGRMGKDQRQE